uniref:Uncharacterized protein n=1 Tax=Aegilops tauschii subsp. strangulata TaxID=200361 RepID=A0A453GCA0_AEGTS
ERPMVHGRLRASGLSLLCFAIMFIFQKLVLHTHDICLEKMYTHYAFFRENTHAILRWIVWC